jgi:dipeptidase E
MASIFAIGGGEVSTGETGAIDRAIRDATGVDEPRVLFVPTASGDAAEYCEGFRSHYEGTLGCEVDVLRLVGRDDDEAGVEEKLAAADAVYVGGGDTGFMLDTWRTRGIDDLLRAAWEDGTVLSGLSAGALCWAAGGLSDAIALEDLDFGPVDGLGFFGGQLTVHATPDRREAFVDYLSIRGESGVALENNAAIQIDGDEWRIHTSSPNAFAFHLQPREDGVAVDVLPADGKFRELSALL